MLADINNSFTVRTRNYFCCNVIAVTYYLPVLLNDVSMTSLSPVRPWTVDCWYGYWAVVWKT